jgi:uncharacterized membrane protein
MFETIFILGRVAVGPAADLFKKRLAEAKADPLFVVLVTFAFVAAVSWPVLFFVKMPAADSHFWLNMAAAAFFDTAGMVLVMMAIGVTELSIYGPLNAYKPAITLALGAAFLGEMPGAGGLAGVAVIIAGSVLLSFEPGRKRSSLAENLRSKGVWLRLSSILLFCVGVIFLKKAVVVSSPFIVLFFWAAFGLALCVLATAVFRPKSIGENIALARRRPADYAAVCVSMTFVQALTLLSFNAMFVGYAIALFQLASLPDVFLGRRFFGERHTAFRFLGASVMIAGALLIVFML